MFDMSDKAIILLSGYIPYTPVFCGKKKAIIVLKFKVKVLDSYLFVDTENIVYSVKTCLSMRLFTSVILNI